jgi:hypothetical protein
MMSPGGCIDEGILAGVTDRLCSATNPAGGQGAARRGKACGRRVRAATLRHSGARVPDARQHARTTQQGREQQ